MKVLFLAEGISGHTRKWVNAINFAGIETVLFSLFDCDKTFYPGTNLIVSSVAEVMKRRPDTSLSKFLYFKALPEIHRVIKLHQPDVVHSLYASSYGLLGALTKKKPYILSVLGTDILEFPELNRINRLLLTYSLNKADKVLATSEYLKIKTTAFTGQNLSVVPFGIDTDTFYRVERRKEPGLVLGTLKNLEPYYSIDVLLRAFALVANKVTIPVTLRIGGEGSEKNKLINLAQELKIDHLVTFSGYINYSDVPAFHNSIDIHITPSSRETFGVSILEASACGVPVIASDIDGFKETLVENVNGIRFKSGDENDLAEKIIYLINNPDVRARLSEQGINFVKENFLLSGGVSKVIEYYREVLNAG